MKRNVNHVDFLKSGQVVIKAHLEEFSDLVTF